MILDDDKTIIDQGMDHAFLTEDLILSMGFEFVGSYNDMRGTRAFRYIKKDLGHFEIFTQELKMFIIKNVSRIKTNIVVVTNVEHPVNDDPHVSSKIDTRYLLTVGELKQLIKFRELTAKISELEHQAEDMLNEKKLPSLQVLRQRVYNRLN